MEWAPAFQAPASQEKIDLIRVGLKALLLRVKINGIDLISPEIKVGVPGRDPAGAAAEVRVEDLVAGFGVAAEDPLVQGDGLLCGVDTGFFVCGVALQHAVPAKFKNSTLPREIGPGDFTIRLIHAATAFVPDDHAGRPAQVVKEEVSAPYHAVLCDPRKLPEIFGVRRGAVVERMVKRRGARTGVPCMLITAEGAWASADKGRAVCVCVCGGR